LLDLLTIFSIDLLELDELNEEENIYVEKCIGFLTQLPFINTCEKVLKTLFKMFMDQSAPTNNNGLPIESYIYNLLYEVRKENHCFPIML